MKLTKLPGAWQLDRLAAAYAANGNFEQAQKLAEKALVMASKKHNDKLAGKISERLELYKQAIPYREPIQPQKTAISDPQDLKE
jgi:thioredoxin-like negative regulator of GroEL